jgi:ribose 5-phosphate isomerase B
MKIALASDHAGFALKNAIGEFLRGMGHETLDVGAFNDQPSDYPDFAEAIAKAVPASAPACATTPTPRIRAWSTTT